MVTRDHIAPKPVRHDWRPLFSVQDSTQKTKGKTMDPSAQQNGSQRWFRKAFIQWLPLALAVAAVSATEAGAASARVVLTPSAGYSITWDGNNGGFFNAAAGAGPSNNVALASQGTVAFGSSQLDFGVHYITNINDGLYGNNHSWISDFTAPDPNPFVGLRFAGTVNVTNIAWSRDNGDTTEPPCGGTCQDRVVGQYTLQFTTIASPDAATAETGDASTGWETIGTVEFLPGADSADFTAYLRHSFGVSQGGVAIAATAVRIKVSDGNIAIDEVEVNPAPDPVPPIANFIEIMPTAGFTITWDRNEGLFSTPNSPAPVPVNDASTNRGAVAFGSSELDFGVHYIRNVNDGLYGNAHSWIPDFAANPDPAPYVGINFGRRLLLRSLAWSRDNGDVAGDCCGGTLTDRALGVYVIQITTVPNPGVTTPEACGPSPESGWVTIGTIHYKSDSPQYFNSWLRHRFDVAQGGAPIVATGVRIYVPQNTSAIDELEVNGNLAVEQQALLITNSVAATITWDGNDGHFNNPATDAAPPANRALATEGTTPFTSSDLGPVLNIPFHRAVNLNDGRYGNANSWISANGIGGNSDPAPFAGLSFGGLVSITNIAWGRDNGNVAGDCCGGTVMDRALDRYHLQYTTVAAPDATTPDTGDAGTGWENLGTVVYVKAAAPFFTPYLRHRFDISASGVPLEATGIRINVGSGQTAIDEIEINTSTTPPPPLPSVGLAPSPGYQIAWDGNDGHYFDARAGAAPPLNRGLATQGTTPFTSSDLGEGLGIPFHRAVNLNDGRYGNSYSWISANGIGGNSDPNPFAGLSFGGTVLVTNIAWSRDNGDNAEFMGTDRTLGVYTLQVTMVASPDATTVETGDAFTGWDTVGTIEYRQADPLSFTPYLRHRFDLANGGAPIEATGVRLKVPNGQIAIDELEVNTTATRPLPSLRIARQGTDLILSWSGGGGLETATSVTGPWVCVPDASSTGYTVPFNSSEPRFYRARR
jgi:hypothetical protein